MSFFSVANVVLLDSQPDVHHEKVLLSYTVWFMHWLIYYIWTSLSTDHSKNGRSKESNLLQGTHDSLAVSPLQQNVGLSLQVTVFNEPASVRDPRNLSLCDLDIWADVERVRVILVFSFLARVQVPWLAGTVWVTFNSVTFICRGLQHTFCTGSNWTRRLLIRLVKLLVTLPRKQ